MNNVPEGASNVVTPDAITLENAPAGIEIGEVEVDGNEAVITLSGNAKEDYDIDREVIITYGLQVTMGDAISTSGDAIVTTPEVFILKSKVIFKATDDPETITASWKYGGAQSTMNEEVITLTIEGGFFNEAGLDKITLGGAAGAAGISIRDRMLVDPTRLNLHLHGMVRLISMIFHNSGSSC